MRDWRSGIIYWFANNPVAANLLMVVIIVLGLYSALTIRKEMFPSTEVNMVTATAVYPGAAPQEVEKGVCQKMEEAVTGTEGVDKITCYARQSVGTLQVEVNTDYDVDEVKDEIKNRIDAINSFPRDVEKPRISKVRISQPVMWLAVHGDLDEKGLLDLAKQVRDEIISLPHVSSADVVGARAFEIAIEIPEKTLREYGLGFDEVAQAIRASSLDLPGGAVKSKQGDILLRSTNQAYYGGQFADIIIRSLPDGSRLTLKDIAVIKDGFEERSGYSEFDGKPTMSIRVNSVGNEDVLAISDDVNAYVKKLNQRLPANVRVDTWGDISHYVRGRLNMMTRNMLQGAILVLLILTLFLRLKVAFWVMVGLPVAFLGVFMVMPWLDISINMLSLFGFILVLGIVVDDAIVIAESAYSEIQRKGHTLENVVRGAQKVALPATFGVLTTIAAFAPMLFVGTIFGSFFEAIGWVVILALIFSLIESKFILPAHLAHMKLDDVGTDKPGRLLRIQRRVNQALERFVNRKYLPGLRKAISRPGLTLLVFAAIFVLSIGLVKSGLVRFVMMPDFAADFIQADIKMVEGTPEEKTLKAIERVKNALLEIDREYSQKVGKEKGAVVKHLFAFTRSQTEGQMIAELVKDENAVITGNEVLRLWKEKVGDIPSVAHLTIGGATGPGQGPDISFKLVGDNLDELRQVAEAIMQKLRGYDGVSDVQSSLESGKLEIQLKLKPLGRNLGLTQRDLASQVRQAFYGEEVQRIQRDDDEVKVMLRLPRSERETVATLMGMRVRSPQGARVPLAMVADARLQEASDDIERVDRKRAVRISADVDISQADPQAIISELQSQYIPRILAQHRSVKLGLDGMSKELKKLMVGLLKGFVLALLLIYLLMAIPLKSYAQPLLIMSVIPFGIVGAIVGHLLTGQTFSMMSIFGVIALAGVVVNDSLVLVDFVNKARAAGDNVVHAVLNAGKQRFRAILLTSLTTFVGLVPILMEKSLQAQVIIPMAISLAFGILFATVITLVLIPVLYVLLARWKGEAVDEAELERELQRVEQATDPGI
jgi:multidrug efflux pump subunit AcrB